MSLKEWREACWTFLFPAFCPGCSEGVEERGDWCEACLQEILDVRQLPLNVDSPLDALWVIGDYRGSLRDKILSYKFAPYERKWRFAFWKLLIEAEEELLFLNEITIAMPIPLHEERLKERGFNQAAEIFEKWVRERMVWEEFLRRTRLTRVQSTLETKEERRENMKQAFQVIGEKDLSREVILLVDDISTSGATFEEAAKALRKKGAMRVIALALASGAMIGEMEDSCTTRISEL